MRGESPSLHDSNLFNRKDAINSYLKKQQYKKVTVEKSAGKCYLLNEATLGIYCTGIPKTMDINDVFKFFNVYGEIDAVCYKQKKRACEIYFYDIRSSTAAYIALKNYSIDEKHNLTIKFIKTKKLEKVLKTPFVILKLIEPREKIASKDEVEQFARSYGDFHLIEPTEDGGYVIYFYDSRQSNQCLAKSFIEFSNNIKYSILPFYNYLNKIRDESDIHVDDFLNSSFEDSLKKLDINVYTPAPSLLKSYHCRLFISLFNKQEVSDSKTKK